MVFDIVADAVLPKIPVVADYAVSCISAYFRRILPVIFMERVKDRDEVGIIRP